MNRSSTRRTRMGERAFTIVEVLIFLIIALVLVGGIYNLLISQQRLYMKQRELQDVRGSLRAAANLLAFELRQASAPDGDLSSIGVHDIKLRSMRGGGVICAVHGSAPRIGLVRTWGEFEATEADSAFVFAPGGVSVGDDEWEIGRILKLWTPAAGGLPKCDWANDAPTDIVAEVVGGYTPPDVTDGTIAIDASGIVRQGATVTFSASHPDLTCSEFDSRAVLKIDADKWTQTLSMTGCTFTVNIPADAAKLNLQIDIESDSYAQLTDDIFGMSEWLDLASNGSGSGDVLQNVGVGAPMRAFRQVQYGLYLDTDSRWWLGRKVGGASEWEKLTGPLAAPSDSGLAFVYYKLNGDTTSVATKVRMVDVILRGESFGKAPRAGDIGPQVQEDSLTIRVTLRG